MFMVQYKNCTKLKPIQYDIEIMSTPLERYQEAVQKWKQITKNIFGTSTGFEFRISPAEGKIFFSKNGIELIKANVFLVSTSAQRGAKLNWIWAWHPKKYLSEIPDQNRFTKEDIDEYSGDLGEYTDYFDQSRILFNLKNPQDKTALVLLRAIALDMLNGKFVYEAEMGTGNNIAQYTFVLSSVKKIKQAVPVSDETRENPESDKKNKSKASPNSDNSDQSD